MSDDGGKGDVHDLQYRPICEDQMASVTVFPMICLFSLPFPVNCLGENHVLKQARIIEVLTFIDRMAFCVF